jgi:uncharacterized DUF497 family protein
MTRNGRPPNRDCSYEEIAFSFERFEWDESKRERNIEQHDIDFRDLAPFFDGLTLARRSDRNDETRWLAVGILEGRVISVIFTQRGESCRIISARRARREEKVAYRELHKGGA